MRCQVGLVLACLVLCPLGALDRHPVRPINLNTATVTELMQLPRVGAQMAERIVQFRKTHYGFRRVEELMNVQGIGEKSFDRLRPYLFVRVAPHA